MYICVRTRCSSWFDGRGHRCLLPVICLFFSCHDEFPVCRLHNVYSVQLICTVFNALQADIFYKSTHECAHRTQTHTQTQQAHNYIVPKCE